MRCCSFRVRLYIRLDSRVCVCMYVRMCVCVRMRTRTCVRVHARASIHVWSLCLYSTMHMHQLSYDKSIDFVSIFFLSVFFFSSPPPLPFPPTYLPPFYALPLPPSLGVSPSPSVFRLFFLAFLRLAQRVYVCTCFSRFPVCTRTTTHTPRIATALRTLLFSSSSLDSRLLCHGNGVIQGSARARARNT